MTQKKTMKCPVCGRRAFDISKIPTEQIEVELKCPHCKHIVTVPCATESKPSPQRPPGCDP